MHVDAVARAAEGEFDAVMDQAFVMGAALGDPTLSSSATVPSSSTPARMRPST